MNKRTLLAAVAVAIALGAPLGAAAPWMSYGQYEPNTALDDPAFGWTEPPAPGQFRIYFNAYATATAGGGGSGVSPNAAALRSSIEPVGNEEQWAVLGVWNDCNGDGYIGIAETAMREYPAALLLDDERCPAKRTASSTCWFARASPRDPCPPWPKDWNNVNGWVTELIPIGNGEVTAGDARVIKDLRAAVWGDYGKPGAITGDAGTCALTPLPRGTAQSTGGILTYADCSTALLELWNTPWQDEVSVLGVPVPLAGDPLGLRFANDDDGGSNALLGQNPTFGDESSENAIVRTGDCEDPENYLVRFSDLPVTPPPLVAWGDGIRAPDTGYLNPNGNVAGTVNYTMESAPFANEQSDDEDGATNTANCDFNDDRGADLYGLVEGDFNSVSATDKREADWNFAFTTMTRGGVPLGLPFGPVPGFGSGPAGGAPSDAGLEPFNAVCAVGCQQSEWFGGSTNVAKTPQTVTTRGTLAGGDLTPAIDSAYWISYYAYVESAKSVAEAPPGEGAYSPCGNQVDGLKNGWNCDRSLWNRNPDGTLPPDPYETLAFPGKVYNLLDVDCYDGSVTLSQGVTVGVLPAAYGDEPCSVA